MKSLLYTFAPVLKGLTAQICYHRRNHIQAAQRLLTSEHEIAGAREAEERRGCFVHWRPRLRLVYRAAVLLKSERSSLLECGVLAEPRICPQTA